jgi:hypothetical protein
VQTPIQSGGTGSLVGTVGSLLWVLVLTTACQSNVFHPAAVASTTPPAVNATQPGVSGGNAELLRAGYRPEMRRGQLVYCRVETVTGSRFAATVCATREDIEAQQAAVRKDLGTSRVDTSCSVSKNCN